MSSLSYVNDPGAGQKNSDTYHYSQAVELPGTGIVKCSGQGGWDPQTGAMVSGTKEQIDLAFENVDNVLRAAGLRGWEDVYLLRTYATDMEASYDYLVEKLQTRIPGHRPLWTALSVPKLAFPPMLIEIEVEAWRGK